MTERFMNFQHLAQKYIKGAKFIMHDRTYDGLEWLGPGEKPPLSFFRDAQMAEDQEARKAGFVESVEKSDMQEKQAQARVRAELDARSHEEKVSAETARVIDEIRAQREVAINQRQVLLMRDELLDSWKEVSATQAVINAEAQGYLDSTDWYVTRKHETGEDIPEAILQDRAKARDRINHGQEVFTHYRALQAKEMPTREEIAASIRKGGEERERMAKIVQDVKLKYPKPRTMR